MTTQYEDTPPKKEALNKPEQPNKKTLIPNRYITTLISILISVGLATMYTKWQISAEKTRIEIQIQALSTEQSAIQHNDKTALSDLEKQLSNTQQKLETAIQERAYQTQDWLLLKARYYLELATIHARWSDDNTATAAILKQADNILAGIRDDTITPVREAIAKEQTDIAQIAVVDATGILAQLNAIQIAINTLKPEQLVSTATTKNQDIPSKSQSWREQLYANFKKLSDLVVIRHQDDDITPLLTPAYVRMMREMIRLNLQEAQWAVLQQNQAIYQFALVQASDNLKRAFNSQDSKTSALLTQLKTLQETPVIQLKPTLGEALGLMNQLIRSKTKSEEGASS